MRKSIFKLIVVALVFIIVAACSDTSDDGNSSSDSNANSNENSNNDSNSNSDSNSEDEKVTVELYTNEHPSWPTDEDWIIWELMEQGANMELDVVIAPDPYDESLNREIASQDLSDMMRITSHATANKYGGEGAFVNLLDHIDEMPNLKKWMEDHPEEARAGLSADGKMYTTPNYGIGETNRMLWLYREDIFAEHDLEIPENWDELYEVAKELKEIYPDSYPFSFRNGTDKFQDFAPNFSGIEDNYYYNEDEDTWHFGAIEDEYLVMLEYFNKFYEEGLIPKDFLSINTEDWQKLITTETSFITQDYIGRIDSFNDQMQSENPDFNLINMAPPAGFPGGEQLARSTHNSEGGFAVAIDSEHKDTVLEFLDWSFSDEGRDTLSWGIEGETYTEENGEKEWIKDYKDPADLRIDTGISVFSTYTLFDYDSHMVLFSDEVKQAYEDIPQYDAPIQTTPAFTKEEQDIIAIQGEAITKHRDEEVAKFVIGKRDLDEFDDFVEEMKNLGVEDIIDIYDKAYQRMLDVEIE